MAGGHHQVVSGASLELH
jgi:hypothetical protein